MLEIVDRTGKVVGTAPRRLAHGDPTLLHRVVHVVVVNARGELLLQKRSPDKDVAPGKWDTSVGGHVAPGESIEAAVAREMKEELGVSGEAPFLYTWIYRSPRESELVFTHRLDHGGPFGFNREEIDEVRFWSLARIRRGLGAGLFSDQFEQEFSRYLEFMSRR